MELENNKSTEVISEVEEFQPHDIRYKVNTVAKKEQRLSDVLYNRQFDTVEELITLYRLGKLSDAQKLKAVLELIQYQYPKKKSIEVDGHIEGGGNIQIINQIIYTDSEINSQEDDDN